MPLSEARKHLRAGVTAVSIAAAQGSSRAGGGVERPNPPTHVIEPVIPPRALANVQPYHLDPTRHGIICPDPRHGFRDVTDPDGYSSCVSLYCPFHGWGDVPCEPLPDWNPSDGRPPFFVQCCRQCHGPLPTQTFSSPALASNAQAYHNSSPPVSYTQPSPYAAPPTITTTTTYGQQTPSLGAAHSYYNNYSASPPPSMHASPPLSPIYPQAITHSPPRWSASPPQHHSQPPAPAWNHSGNLPRPSHTLPAPNFHGSPQSSPPPPRSSTIGGASSMPPLFCSQCGAAMKESCFNGHPHP